MPREIVRDRWPLKDGQREVDISSVKLLGQGSVLIDRVLLKEVEFKELKGSQIVTRRWGLLFQEPSYWYIIGDKNHVQCRQKMAE